ncbi:hypothetical protein EAH_00036710, partial [Eimeria acervulina]
MSASTEEDTLDRFARALQVLKKDLDILYDPKELPASEVCTDSYPAGTKPLSRNERPRKYSELLIQQQSLSNKEKSSSSSSSRMASREQQKTASSRASMPVKAAAERKVHAERSSGERFRFASGEKPSAAVLRTGSSRKTAAEQQQQQQQQRQQQQQTSSWSRSGGSWGLNRHDTSLKREDKEAEKEIKAATTFAGKLLDIEPVIREAAAAEGRQDRHLPMRCTVVVGDKEDISFEDTSESNITDRSSTSDA